MTRFVIVGGGTAGASAAFALREAGFEGEIVLIGAEAWAPYQRPSLSKEYLRGEQPLAELQVRPAEDYARLGIDRRPGQRAVSVRARDHLIGLASGEEVRYDRLLVATGARARSLEVPGADLPGVVRFRTVDDADEVRSRARSGGRALVVGFGFIGCEVAASLRMLGLDVVAVEAGDVPLAAVLGEEVGAVLGAFHRERAVGLVTGDSIVAFEGAGKLQRARTRQGRLIACDVAIVGIGAIVEGQLLAEAGAAMAHGVRVDAACRTSLPDVYAAGDVTQMAHPVLGAAHVEHWNNAYRQGRAAALSMLDREPTFDYVYSFWSDQYDHSVEYVGLADASDRLAVRGRLEDRRFLGSYLRDGRLRAAVGIDRGGDPEDKLRGGELKKCVQLIRSQAHLDPARLADEGCSVFAAAAT